MTSMEHKQAAYRGGQGPHRSGPDRYDAHDTYQSSSNYSPERAYKIFVHNNGDEYNPAKEILVRKTPGTFDNFLADVSDKLKPQFICGRRLFSAGGRTRVTGVDHLKEGHTYVLAGNERFKRLNYKDIRDVRPRKHVAREHRWDEIKPVVHSKDQRLRDKSGRAYYLSGNVKGVYVNVHVWDRFAQTPRRYNVNPHLPFAQIKKEIANHVHVDEERFDMYNFQYGGNTVTPVEQPDDFSKEYAVMVFEHRHKQGQHHLHGHGYWEDMITKNLYKYTRSGRPNFHVYKNNNMVFGVPPDYRHGKTLNKYSVLGSIPSSKQSGGPISPYSNPPSQGRKLNSNRSKPSRQVDYDEDHSGVYRAKGQDNAKGAKQEKINEDMNEGRRQDQWDDSFNQTDRTDRTDNHRNSTPKSARDNRRRDEEKEVKAATKLQAGARGWKARKEYQVKKAEKKQRDDSRRQEEEMRQQGDMKRRQDEEKQKEVAASKIQAGFKGYQVRKDMRATQKGQK